MADENSQKKAFVRGLKSACASAQYYISVETNEHGNLQVHPCGYASTGCSGAFIYCPAKRMWVKIIDEMLQQRLQRAVDEAIKDKASGFYPCTKVPLWEEDGWYTVS